MRARQEAPVPRVVGLVAIVPHHPIARGRHHDGPPRVHRGAIGLGVLADVAGQLEAAHLRGQSRIVGDRRARQVEGVGLVQRLAVAVHGVVHHLQRVAGHADHPFHDIEVGRRVLDRAEHHDAVRLGIGEALHPQKAHAHERDLELAAVGQFVDEQEVAHEQRVFHARRRNAERLDDVGPQEQPDDQRDRQRLAPAPHLVTPVLGRHGGRSGRPRGGRRAARHGRSTQSAMKMLVSCRTFAPRLDSQTRSFPSGENMGNALNPGLVLTCARPVPSRLTR